MLIEGEQAITSIHFLLLRSAYEIECWTLSLGGNTKSMSTKRYNARSLIEYVGTIFKDIMSFWTTLETFVIIKFLFDGVPVKACNTWKEVVMLMELMTIQCGTAYCVFPDIGIVGSGQSRCLFRFPNTKGCDSHSFDQTRSHLQGRTTGVMLKQSRGI